MTLQDVFDTGLLAIRQQGRAGMTNFRCAYRGNEGTKCVAGHLITDHEYLPAMEGHSVVQLSLFDMFPQRLMFARGLIAEMQNAHDTAHGDDVRRLHDFMLSFEARMSAIAEQYGLMYTRPDGSTAEKAGNMPVVQSFDRHADWVAGNTKRISELVSNVLLRYARANGNVLVGPSVVNQGVNHAAPTRATAEHVLMQNGKVLT